MKVLKESKVEKNKLQERLMKYFLQNIDYFKHIATKCKCFTCDCG